MIRNISSITDDLVLSGNIGLTSLNGLAQLQTIETCFLIDNTILEDVSGLSDLNTVGGYFGFASHPNLCEDDVTAIANQCTIGGSTDIDDNDGTCQIDVAFPFAFFAAQTDCVEQEGV